MYINMKDGCEIYVQILGQGYPILFLHGNSLSSRYFSRQKVLAERYQLIFMDSRGQGKSSKVTQNITFEQMSEDIHQVLLALKISSCLIVGHSDGANLALLHCQQYPNEVAGMLLNGGNFEFMGLRPFSRLTARLEVFGFNTLGLVSPYFKKMAAVVQLQKVNVTINKGFLNTLLIPVFVAVGQHDMILDKHSQEMANFFQNGRLIVVPHHGHFIAWTKPNLFHQLVDQLVSLILEQKKSIDS